MTRCQVCGGRIGIDCGDCEADMQRAWEREQQARWEAEEEQRCVGNPATDDPNPDPPS